MLKNRALFTINLLLISTLSVSATAYAQTKKFVYVFDQKGGLVLPNNAADQCPDPAGDNSPADTCHGVLVDEDGHYSIRLPSKKISKNKLVLVANEYEFIAAGGNNNSGDLYILFDSKRRADEIEKDHTNNGVDINRLSEASVKAIEKIKNLPTGRKGSVISQLTESLQQIDVNGLNHTMGNSRSDNTPNSDNEQRDKDFLDNQQNKLDESDNEVLTAIAELALLNENNDAAKTLIRKNTRQALVEPAHIDEVANRVYSHISAANIDDNNTSVILLESDKYLVYLNEPTALTTANSINPSNFFAYTWQGVDSISSSATFAKAEKGSYLVCVSGEIDNSNDSSTDCVRLKVKDVVDAVARASRLRVGTGNSIKVLADLSLGATSYSWTGAGTFSTSNAEESLWTAPQIAGLYELTLSINDAEDSDTLSITVYDVLPVAVAEADQYSVYLENNSAIINLESGSISTDGSAVDSIQWSIINSPEDALAGITDNSAQATQFTTSKAGDYTIQLLASKRGQTDVTSLKIQIKDPGKPVAHAGDDIIAFRNSPVTLDGSHSTAPIGKSLSFLWSASAGYISDPALASTAYVSNTLGEHTITLQVSDGLLQDTDQLSVNVRNRLPSSSDDVAANLLNEILEGQLLAVDSDGDSLRYSLISEPTSGGVTIDNITGEYTYLPGGVKGCKYHPYNNPSDNESGGKDVPVIKLCADRYVTGIGEAVHLTTSNSINASKFSGYEWLNGAIGDPNDIRQATYVGTEAGLQQVCVIGNIGRSNNTSTACVDIFINGNSSDVDDEVETGYTDSFQFQVNDGFGNSNISTVFITVGWENSLPQVLDLALTTSEDNSVSAQLQGSDEDEHSLTYRITGNGSLGSAVISNIDTGSVIYTPNENAHGIDTLSFVANDGLQDSQAGTLTVTISSANDAPVAHYTGALTTFEDQAATSALGVTDPDADVMDFRLATIPNKGDVVITNTQTGEFIYTPHADKNGADSFYFVVHDGSLESNAAKVNINITPVNDDPIVENSGPLTTRADEPLAGTLGASDIDRDALIYEIVTAASKGSVELDATTGAFTFIPNGTNLGSDGFTFVAKDALVSSNIATVSLNIIAANIAPVANSQSISVFEGVAYGGVLTGSDADSGSLIYSIVDQGRLGTASISNPDTGEFVFTPHAFSAGKDFFTFKVSDGDKDSMLATVYVDIQISAVLCQGPGNEEKDSDNDGYADFVEQAFLTLANDPNSTPNGLNPSDYGVSFTDDDDNDGYSDIAELWLETGHTNNQSVPSLSTLNNVPNCLTPLFDTIPPVVFAFNILTPTLDAGSGSAKARFALTTLDNAVGIKDLYVKLISPSGSVVEANSSVNDEPVVVYTEFESNTFGKYAQAGIWTVEVLSIKDVKGNELILDTAALAANNYPTTIDVTNLNSDIVKPVLNSFSILTPAVDVSSGNAVAGVRCEAADNLAGISRISVSLRSPSGNINQWGEINRADHPTNLTATINSNAFNTFTETGTWNVSEVTIHDDAGNVLQLDTAALQDLGYSTAIEVSGATVDNQGPTLSDIEILTPVLDPSAGDVRASFRIVASDAAGIGSITLVLQGPSGQFMNVDYSSLDAPASFDSIIYSPVFPSYAEPGPCVYYSLSITDSLGNISTWNTQQLADLGFVVSFDVNNPGYGYGGSANNAPFAYSGSFQTNEDTAYNGNLNAVDVDGNPIIYQVVENGQYGNVVITDSETGAFTYTPAANAFGSDRFTYKVDDGTEESNPATVTVIINATADDTLVEDQSITVIQNSTYNGYITATDADNESLLYTVIDNGQLGTASFLTGGTFQFTPNAGVTGSDQFTFQVNDGNSTSRTGIVTVTIVADLTLVDFQVLTSRVSGYDQYVYIAANITLSKNIAQIDEALLYLQGPQGQIVGLRSYLPENAYPFTLFNNFFRPNEPLDPGIWTFNTLLIKENGSEFSRLVVDDIEAAGFEAQVEVVANTSPTATTSDVYTTSIDRNKQGFLSATDPEGDALTYRIVSGGNKGAVTLLDANTGEFSYQPHAIGSDSFTFVANDGLSDSNTGSVSFTINENNGVPVAYNAGLSVTANIAYIGKLNAVDSDGDPLNFNVVNQPGLGTVTFTDAKNGDFIYRPNPDVTGEDIFSFNVNDGAGDSNIATVTINIRLSNGVPVANSRSVTAFQDVVYSGQLSGSDHDGDSLSYQLVSDGSLGSVTLNPSTGAFTYTPQPGLLGRDQFSFTVNDAQNSSQPATVTVNIISPEQACGTGGVVNGLDTDGDGYVDFLETALGTDPQADSSTPAGIDAADLGVSFSADSDGDGYDDRAELWLDSDPDNSSSEPDYVLDACFSAISDGIKPRLIGFDILTPTIDMAGGDNVISLSMTILDNASGIKRARVGLLSPSDVYVSSSVSFYAYPLLTGLQVDIDNLSEYAEAGEWRISSVTLFDEAGNRLDVTGSDLTDAGHDSVLQIINSAGDSAAPGLDAFSIETPIVYPGTADDVMSVSLTISDSGSGVGSARVDFIGPAGVIVSASQTLATNPPQTTLQLDSAQLSQYLEDGIWAVHSVLLVDAAGNSVQVVDELAGRGFDTSLTVTNPLSDANAPSLDSFSILTSVVYPASGDARMSFAVTASDDAAGIDTIRVDLVGPSGQVLHAWGYFSDNYPLNATAQVNSAILSNLTEAGTWYVNALEVFDNAGNSTLIGASELQLRLFSTEIEVLH